MKMFIGLLFFVMAFFFSSRRAFNKPNLIMI